MVDKSIFQTDSRIGCPFDDSEVELVQEWKGFRVGEVVRLGMSDITGEIVAIGIGARYRDGSKFVAFMIKAGDSHILKNQAGISHLVD